MTSRAEMKKAKAIADGTAPKEATKSILGKNELVAAQAERQRLKAEKLARDEEKAKAKAKDAIPKSKLSKKEQKKADEAAMLAMLAGGAGGKKKKKKKAGAKTGAKDTAVKGATEKVKAAK